MAQPEWPAAADRSPASEPPSETTDHIDEAALAEVMRVTPLGAGVLAGILRVADHQVARPVDRSIRGAGPGDDLDVHPRELDRRLAADAGVGVADVRQDRQQRLLIGEDQLGIAAV